MAVAVGVAVGVGVGLGVGVDVGSGVGVTVGGGGASAVKAARGSQCSGEAHLHRRTTRPRTRALRPPEQIKVLVRAFAARSHLAEAVGEGLERSEVVDQGLRRHRRRGRPRLYDSGRYRAADRARVYAGSERRHHSCGLPVVLYDV